MPENAVQSVPFWGLNPALFRIDRWRNASRSVRKRDRCGRYTPLCPHLSPGTGGDRGRAAQYTSFNEGCIPAAQRSAGRCLSVPGAELSNTAVENSIRPLKLGARLAGPLGIRRRAAAGDLFTVVENCRQAASDLRGLSNRP